MSSYSDMANDHAQARWLERWVPETQHELGHDLSWEQYRFTLARAREAESELGEIKDALHVLRSRS